ncbi:MAG: sn-glycerol-3-phosphate ABC transporter substrate-binding protein, partial [Spirochaetaceae bacterium]
EYEGVSAFFEYLSSPEVQAEWHQFSGYLPITNSAWELTREQGFYEEVPIHNTAIEQITLNEPTENSRGLRFGNFPQIRDEILTAMEAIFAGDLSAQEGLDQAVERGNELLREFEQTVEE